MKVCQKTLVVTQKNLFGNNNNTDYSGKDEGPKQTRVGTPSGDKYVLLCENKGSLHIKSPMWVWLRIMQSSKPITQSLLNQVRESDLGSNAGTDVLFVR